MEIKTLAGPASFSGCISDALAPSPNVTAIFVQRLDRPICALIERLNHHVSDWNQTEVGDGRWAYVFVLGPVEERQLKALPTRNKVFVVVENSSNAAQAQLLSKCRLNPQAQITVMAYDEKGRIVANCAYHSDGELGLGEIDAIVAMIQR